MAELINRVWRVCLIIAHRCACVVFAVTKPNLRGVFVAVWCDGKVLLIRNSYRKGWTLPGGLVNRQETWEEAAVRETFEEVGVSIDIDCLDCKAEVAGELGPRDRARIFETEVAGPVEITIDRREVVAAEFVTGTEALERMLNRHVAEYLRNRECDGAGKSTRSPRD